MLSLTRSKFGISINEIFFASATFKPSSDAAIWFLVQSKTPHKHFQAVKTQVIHLEQDLAELFATLSSNTRYKIKRAEREGLQPCVNNNPTDSDIATFTTFFNEFAEHKKLPRCNTQKLNALKVVDGLILTSVSNNQGQVLSSHAYVKDNDSRRARLLYSASHFRALSSSSDKNVVGRANRLLHWHEISAFKDMNLRYYDLGGLPMDDSNPEKNAIARFKLEFGGEQVVEYSGFIPGTVVGRLVLAVAKRS